MTTAQHLILSVEFDLLNDDNDEIHDMMCVFVSFFATETNKKTNKQKIVN